MAIFAVHDSGRVVNVVVADSAEVAEDVTGLSAIETDGVPWIDWTLHGNEWRPPTPFPSWTWDYSTGCYVAPIACPDDHAVYFWDEEQGDWIEFTPLTSPEE